MIHDTMETVAKGLALLAALVAVLWWTGALS